MLSFRIIKKKEYAGRRKKKVRGDRQWVSRVYVGWRTAAGGYLAFFSASFRRKLGKLRVSLGPAYYIHIYNAALIMAYSHFFIIEFFSYIC